MRRKSNVIYWYRIYHYRKIKCWFDVKRTNVYVNLPPNSPGLSSVLRGLHTLERGGIKKTLTPYFFLICLSWISIKEENLTLVNNHFFHSFFELVGCAQAFDSSTQHPLLLGQPALQSGYLVFHQLILSSRIKRLTFSGDN